MTGTLLAQRLKANPHFHIHPSQEIYGGKDSAHLPSTGSNYRITITRGHQQSYPWVDEWDQDEGAKCIVNEITESHTAMIQQVVWNISTPS